MTHQDGRKAVRGSKINRIITGIIALALIDFVYLAWAWGYLGHPVISDCFVEMETPTGHRLFIEVAYTDLLRHSGLSGRPSMKPADGLAIVFSEPQHITIWMKAMRFDLDLLWLRDNEVVHIIRNVPAPDFPTPHPFLPTYGAPQTADMVLELPAGSSHTLGLDVGSRVLWEPNKPIAQCLGQEWHT